jgi:c-di-GMP-related signal transduction protein
MDLRAATPEPASFATSPTRFIARQPIFDREEKVYGYELLFRSGLENLYTAKDGDAAARDVADNFLNADARILTAGQKAFINATRQFLIDEYATLLPKDKTVIEILETIEPDEEVLEACRALKDWGYVIALDDFVYDEKFQPFIDLANLIKIDFKISSSESRRQAVERFAPRGIQLLAEKVETREEFAEARGCGYSYFQGYFFCKPQIIPSVHIPAFKVHYLRILQAINQPDLDRDEIVDLIEREISLCYKLLRLMNSSLFGFRREISSTSHALALLGDREVRKWASVAAVLGIAGNKPNELVSTSLARGRCCELLVASQGTVTQGPSMFLLGVLSLMDAMLGRPIAEIVSEIALPEMVRAALLGEPNRFRKVLDLVKAFEAGEWSNVSELAAEIHVEESKVSAAYLQAVDWVQRIFKI